MALPILIVFISLMLLIVFILVLLSNLSKEHETIGTGTDILSAPIVPKTIEQILKDALKNPPTGCMWEVKKQIKHYRDLPSGKSVFDGTVDVVLAEIRLITPYSNRAFTLPISDIVEFEKSLRFNSRSLLKDYSNQLQAIESKNKQINDDWDGVYS